MRIEEDGSDGLEFASCAWSPSSLGTCKSRDDSVISPRQGVLALVGKTN